METHSLGSHVRRTARDRNGIGGGGRIIRRLREAACLLRTLRVLSRAPVRDVQDVRVSQRPWLAESDPLESNEGSMSEALALIKQKRHPLGAFFV